jgi:hypothetical protein
MVIKIFGVVWGGIDLSAAFGAVGWMLNAGRENGKTS